MATWEEMLSANYNPVTSLRERFTQREAENLARMQQANPGYGTNPGMPQYQQFTSPSSGSQDDWLETQRNLFNEQFVGNSASNATNNNVSNTTNNQSLGGAQGSDSEGGMPGTGGMLGGNNSVSNDAVGGYRGISQADLDASGAVMAPSQGLQVAAAFAGPIIGMPFTNAYNTQLNAFNESMADDKAELAGQLAIDPTFGSYSALNDQKALEDIDKAINDAIKGLSGVSGPEGYGGGQTKGGENIGQGPGTGKPGGLSDGRRGGQTMGGGNIGQGPGTGKGGGSSGGNTGGGGSGGGSGGTGGGGAGGANGEK